MGSRWNSGIERFGPVTNRHETKPVDFGTRDEVS
jgi:hypothetical protein